jgi:class 3 adenylate cyclase
MCTGMLQRKLPTAVGQADYYGVVANTAARIMGKAAPGQVLVEANLPFTKGDPSQCQKSHSLHVMIEGTNQGAEIELCPHGTFQLKGLATPTPTFLVCPRGAFG